MPQHLKKMSAGTIAANLTPDDKYWVGRLDGAAFDKGVDDAYGPEFALRRMLLPIIQSRRIDGAKAEARLNTAIEALLGLRPPQSTGKRVADDDILIEVGRRVHREIGICPDFNEYGMICREVYEKLYPEFVSLDLDERKKIITRLRKKFKANMDHYCLLGSTLSDDDMKLRQMMIDQAIELLRRLGVVRGR